MWNVIGQDRAVDMLRRALDANRLPHALLLTGPEGVGKTHLALQLAQALNCVGPDAPCGECVHCHQIEIGSHPDVVVVERPEGKEGIAIAQVRELRDAASLRPFQGRRKVYIIAAAEALTGNAADALLKTLEEPQPQLTMILTASDDEALPPTIVSRCRVIPLVPVPADVIAGALVERGEDAESAARLARLARGSMGWALRAARQPRLATQQRELTVRLADLWELDLEGRLRLIESLTDKKDRAAVRRSLELMLLLARDLLLIAGGLEPRYAGPEEGARLARQARDMDIAAIHANMAALKDAMERIDQNVDPRLALEAAIISAT
jgi:DNA polymerase-3 subunit delta'